ncbi:hypothetical protein VTK73DRAFT_4885 [Phialemonium thermophilum]|uniref:Xylanolytic transcriptional activator regulatory domain-containing protein n=1 Tax=Phialemonium thermophilum TaxID=223376 RepID=A0ABR3WR24_9PEZI
MCAGDKPFEPDPGGPLPIPSVATASELLAFYFDVCIATYRFLHRPTVAAWLDRLQSNKAQGLPLAHGLGEMKAAVVLTILAIGIFHRAMSRGRQDPVHEEFLSLNHSDRLFSEAARLVDTAKGFPNLVSVQARLIQVLYLLHSSRMNQAWYAFGNVFQTIAVLGLHRRTNRARTLASKAATRDYIQSQCQKRTFWSTYILDIYLGVIFGRPRHYHDEDIDQDLPDAVNDEDMTAQGPAARKGHKDCAIEVLICHAKIARIVANISRRIYRDGKARMESLAQRAGDLVGDLARWKSELPPFLGSVNPTSLVPPYRRQATSMKLAYCHAMMHANRPFLLRRMEADRGHSDLVQRRIVDCMAAAREVLEMVDDMASDGTLFHAFWWTHYVAFCSLAIVYVWQIQRNGAGNDNNNETTGGTALAPDLDGLFDLAERCQHHLAEATASNSPSRRYSIILEELRQEAMSYTARGPRQVYAEQTDVKGRDVESGGPHEEGSRLDHHHHDSAPFSMEASQVNGGYLPAHVWDNWQTTDWLDMDSLALGTFSGFELSPQSWFPEQPSNGLFF